MVREIIIQAEDRTMNCRVENNREGGTGDIYCEVYDEPWLKPSEMAEYEPMEEIEVDSITGKNINITLSGYKEEDYIVVRDD